MFRWVKDNKNRNTLLYFGGGNLCKEAESDLIADMREDNIRESEIQSVIAGLRKKRFKE
jgi:hypothetical protein